MPPQALTGSAPTQIPAAALVQQKLGAAVTDWAIGAFCIFGWEWLLCLPLEYKQIWTKPMNNSSVLYIANRYFGLLQLSFVTTLVTNVWSPNACNHVYFWEPVGALISTVLSQMILGSRVYAIFSQNKVVAFVLGSTLIVEVIVGGIAISTTSPRPPNAGPVATATPCGAVIGPFGWLLAFWTIPLFYDTNTFLLTAWKAYGYWRNEVDTPLFDIIWRDGLLYFFVIFFMNAANVIIFSTVSPTSPVRAFNLTPTLVLEVVLSCRLLLNLRSVVGESPATKARPTILPWSVNSNTRSHTNPSSTTSIIGQSRSMELQVSELEPNRARPHSTWNAQILYQTN